jgi:mannose/fructose/N-acetylgalactosamine-specific phosphotransferase system component IID
MWDLLTLQGAFSARHLQRCGFLASVGPARGGSPAVAALRTALADGPPPNTHPVLAAALVGALERAEADAADAGPPRPLARLVEIGGPILAQWGDRAIWGGARRLWGAVAVLLALPFGLAAALAMAGVSLALHMLGRVLLRRWGWRVGWDLVRGGSGWLWRRGPRWAERAGLPVSAGVLAVAATLGWSAGPSAGAFGLRLVWFMLGVLLGGSAHRPTAWGWICWVAASVGAGLDVWSARTGW